MAPLTPQVARPQTRNAVATGPQSRWIVPAAATAAAPSNRVAAEGGSLLFRHVARRLVHRMRPHRQDAAEARFPRLHLSREDVAGEWFPVRL